MRRERVRGKRATYSTVSSVPALANPTATSTWSMARACARRAVDAPGAGDTRRCVSNSLPNLATARAAGVRRWSAGVSECSGRRRDSGFECAGRGWMAIRAGMSDPRTRQRSDPEAQSPVRLAAPRRSQAHMSSTILAENAQHRRRRCDVLQRVPPIGTPASAAGGLHLDEGGPTAASAPPSFRARAPPRRRALVLMQFITC